MNQLAPGKVIGQRYQLVQKIAAGGMGQVFKAVDTRLFNRPVAVKLLHQNLAGDENTCRHLLKRFQQEIRISTLLGEHPAIVKVLDYGLENNQPYLVMEYLRGHSLGELMLKHPLLPPQQVVKIARQVCAGLYYAHNLETEQDGHLIKGVIHRDIKPSNLFVLKDETLGETVKILDFGIAKLLSDVSLALGTQTTGFLGTVRYASPEQVRGEELDPRSDIYSFGVVLHRMLTGQHPLQPKTDSFPGWYEAHNYQQPRPFDRSQLPHEIPPALEEVVLACLAKDPGQRPQTMKLLSDQLEGSLQSHNSAGSSLTPPPTTSPFSERTLAAIDDWEGAQPESRDRQIPLWGGIALFAAIAGSTFWGLRLLLRDRLLFLCPLTPMSGRPAQIHCWTGCCGMVSQCLKMILIRFGRTLNPNPRPHRHPPLRLRPLQRRPPRPLPFPAPPCRPSRSIAPSFPHQPGRSSCCCLSHPCPKPYAQLPTTPARRAGTLGEGLSRKKGDP
ncbi:serine/threonine protein kinase [Synechococcus sp. H60.4]|uniref:serine/threonine protein kinase n=3 Tax=unclassified Synechococcus TaxID=2626047 RepID=UPI0039C27CDE